MTKISQNERVLPRHDQFAGASQSADPTRAASVARIATDRFADLRLPLASQRPRTGGTPAPRAMLPPVRAAATPLPGALLRGSSRAIATVRLSIRVQLEQLPPVPRIRDPKGGWRLMWRSQMRRTMFDPLRLQYQQQLGKDVSGAKFLEKVVDLTGAAGTQAFTTPRADTTLFVVRIPGVREPVPLLRRDAETGTLGDIVRLTTSSDEEIAKELAGIAHRQLNSVGLRNRKELDQAAEAQHVAGAPAPSVLPDVRSPHFFKTAATGKARAQSCAPALERYVASTGRPMTMPSFLEMVFRKTASAEKRPTDRPDISHFIVHLPGTEEPLHVLRRDTHDGFLANVNIAESGDPDAVAREIAVMSKTARSLAARGRVKEDGARRTQLPRELSDVYEAFRARPENINLAETTFHAQLCEWAGDATDTARKTRLEGIERFTVNIPHYGPVVLLGQRDERGRVVSVERLESDAELEHKLRRMQQLAKVSRNVATAKRAGAKRDRRNDDDNNRRDTMWRVMKSPLQGEFQTWKQQHVGRLSGAASFVAHLEDLCGRSGEPVIADEAKSVTRHRITPNPGGPAFSVLRYTNAAGVVTGMRVIDATLTEQQAIKAMSAFEQRSLTSRLAKKPASAPRVLARDLDLPAVKQVTNAKEMQRALEGMLANQRKGEKNLLLGLENDDELRTWFQLDGSLMTGRTAGSLARLPGFNRARQSIVSVLTQLGQQDVVRSFQPPTSAELLARVLKARVDHPEADTDQLMQVIGVASETYRRYLSLSTGELHSNTRLRYLPDYEAHWTEIRDALSQLGHTEQAAHLRGPVDNPAERLIYGIEDEMYSLRRALHAMREEGLPRLKAARRAGLSDPGLLRVIADNQGRVRNLQFIASRLPGETSPEMAGRLGAAVRRLSAQAERDMAVWRFKGRHVRKLFVVGINAARRVGGPEARRLRDLYADNPDLIRKARSFEGERPRQTLRWLSTALRNWSSPGAIEIQTYYDPKKKEIWVSSNVDKVNEKLDEFLTSGGLMDKLVAFDEGPDHASRKNRDRTYRQVSNLKRAISDPSLLRSVEAKDVLKAMAEGRFRVPPPKRPRNREGSRVNLHSELRIRDSFLSENGHPLDPMHLAGTRRPCGICAKDLGLPPSARRGPIWLSRASRARHDPQAVAEANAKAAIPTFISQTRDGRWTADHNTDSESDLERPTAKRPAAAGRTEPPAKRQALDDAGSGRPVRERASALPTVTASRFISASVSRLPQPTASGTLGNRTADGQRIPAAWAIPQADPDFVASLLGRPAATPEATGAALQTMVMDRLQQFTSSTWHDDTAYESLPTLLGRVQTATGFDVARAIRIAESLGAHSLMDAARRVTVERRETEIEALQEDALDAAMLLHRQVEFPVPKAQIGPLLQGLLGEGRQRFDAFRARLATQSQARATPEQRQEMRQLGELSLRMRRSAAALGWLPARASPTDALPAGVRPPADGNWATPMRDLFTPGSASGARNICWFDTLAQLALDESRDLGGDMRPVDSLAAELREAADRLGLTEAGAMADNDAGALHLIAHALGVQVHVFHRQPDDRLELSALESVGAPEGQPVYVFSDDTHFEPLWPAWAEDRTR